MTEVELMAILGVFAAFGGFLVGLTIRNTWDKLAIDCANLRAEQAERGKRELLTCWRCGHKEKRLVCDCEKMNWEGGDPT